MDWMFFEMLQDKKIFLKKIVRSTRPVSVFLDLTVSDGKKFFSITFAA